MNEGGEGGSIRVKKLEHPPRRWNVSRERGRTQLLTLATAVQRHICTITLDYTYTKYGINYGWFLSSTFNMSSTAGDVRRHVIHVDTNRH